MPKETINELNKKVNNLKNMADSLILVMDPEFKKVSILMRKYCIVKYQTILDKYKHIISTSNNNHYGSLVSQISSLEDIIRDLNDLLEKGGAKGAILVDIDINGKTKSLK